MNAKTAEVAKCIQRGLTNKEISAAMSLPRQTVLYHIAKLSRMAGLWGNADTRRLVVWVLTKWRQK
jgi:predicted transcriptional regulator